MNSDVTTSTPSLHFAAFSTEGVDYTLSSNHTLELPFPLLTGTSEQCFPVFQLCEDDVPENNESFTISVSVPPNTPSVFQQKNFTVTIIDNDRKNQTLFITTQ